MDRHGIDELPRIDMSLDPIRAAISIVADGIATSVTVQVRTPSRVMPATRQLARAAGVSVELVGQPERVVTPSEAQEGA